MADEKENKKSKGGATDSSAIDPSVERPVVEEKPKKVTVVKPAAPAVPFSQRLKAFIKPVAYLVSLAVVVWFGYGLVMDISAANEEEMKLRHVGVEKCKKNGCDPEEMVSHINAFIADYDSAIVEVASARLGKNVKRSWSNKITKEDKAYAQEIAKKKLDALHSGKVESHENIN